MGKTTFPRSILSDHAILRVRERFDITPEALLDLLNAGHGKRVGSTFGATHLAHRLLWSPVDTVLLVVIQNIIDGTILTTLPLWMYRARYPRNVIPARMNTVIQQMVRSGHAPADLWVCPPKLRVLVSAHLPNESGWRGIGGYACQIDSPWLAPLGERIAFWQWVGERLQAQGLSVEGVESVGGRLPDGDFQVIPYRVLSSKEDTDTY